ncbi:T9SS type A sorting domain-containing protein [Taibaiella soli]|uniref:Secretion system C-terminal sorting domain-containing protein n=1 Tax=Taibaiella soli TaxID=1649169 RepID=A0A2W2AFJ2_9BACT|nr:T9SS type A sorting domain-containing protein [Taibaiella soli]PZF74071.1 hypothetical protein DN068_05100 [Taibaiella soli]
MKKLLLGALLLCAAHWTNGQTKPFIMYAVAEGNFGTPNGDVFKVSKGFDTIVTVSAPLYQTANGATGFDVLQDFEIAGNKAVFTSKSSTSKIAIANFPAFDSVKTFAITGGQCMGKASATKVYISYAQGNTIKLVDLINNTLTTVADPSSSISSYATYMASANGYMYVAMSSKIVKIDTATNAVVGTILPGLGSIAGLQYDTANKQMWILGKSSSTSAVVRMDVLNNDFLNTAIVFTGVTNAAQLRYYNNKLYFLSGKSVHIYNILNPNIPTTPVYTSTLGGTASGFAYGKSFTVDPTSGDFAIGSANSYAANSLYEVIDGTTFSTIATGLITGCQIVNELALTTSPALIPPVPTVTNLPVVKGQCGVTLIAPTATSDTATITGTTTSPLTYAAQGSYTVIWTYTNAVGTTTQTQSVIVADTIPPVPDILSLPVLTVNCPYTITNKPTATDNCLGLITATTTSPLTYANGGTYTVIWTYTDSSANVTSQTQTLNVVCNTSSVPGMQSGKFAVTIAPNPAVNQLHVHIENGAEWTLSLSNIIGREVAKVTSRDADYILPVAQLTSGIYYATIYDRQTGQVTVQKVVISH